MDYIQRLNEDGFAIIPNLLSIDEQIKAKEMFLNWKQSIPNHDFLHNNIDPHGIYKYLQAGHQEHAWYLRTRPQIQDIFKKLWNTEELIVSYDGNCYIDEKCKKKDKIWTHTDQAPNSPNLECYQGFVSLTNNKSRTLVVYKGSHKLHERYFKDRNIKSSKNWQLIDHKYLKEIENQKCVLEVPAGALVIWDSRTFHQNQYGNLPEERIVQYLCYLPKDHPKNTESNTKKRIKYFLDKRTTSHWPCPVKVNGLQPQTYGDSKRIIDYTKLKNPKLDYLLPEILKLI